MTVNDVDKENDHGLQESEQGWQTAGPRLRDLRRDVPGDRTRNDLGDHLSHDPPVTPHIRYAVQLVGTEQYLQQARYLRTSPFQSCKLYSRQKDADKIAERWNNRRNSPYFNSATCPEAKVVSVGVIQRIEVAS